MYQAADLRELVREHHVRFLRLQFTDVFGRFKNIAVPVTELERVLANQVSVDGSVFTGLPEMHETTVYLHPDYATFMLFPWRPRDGAVARLICDGHTKNGLRFPGCSRGVLAETIKKAAGMNLALSAGAAIDFFLFHVDGHGKPTLIPQDYAGICDLSPLDLGENARRDMVNTLDEMGIEVAFSHHGGAPGKNRICLKTDAAGVMADKIITFKFVIQAVAQRHGLYASFIPKPFKEHPGAGMSLFLLLFEGDKNAFRNDSDPWGLSGTAYSFAAGIAGHARGLTALCCPSVISYKRLVSDGYFPVLAGLSPDNRLAMLAPALLGGEPVLECWIPDALSNPYLVLAAILTAGMEGVSKAAKLPVVTRNELATKPADGSCPESLPQYLGAAVEALKGDTLLHTALGDLVFKLYLRKKVGEWNEFLREIHPWEIERYLP